MVASTASSRSAVSIVSRAPPRIAPLAPALARTISQPAGGDRQRALEDALPDSGEQVLVDGGQRAADDDDARIEHADHDADDIADGAAGVADPEDRLGQVRG